MKSHVLLPWIEVQRMAMLTDVDRITLLLNVLGQDSAIILRREST